MSDCTPCPPCDTEFPVFCEGLETTTDGRRLVVEDTASCQKVLLEPSEISVLQYDGNNDVAWKSGSLTAPIKLPSLQLNAVNVAPKIMVLLADGTVRQWQPTDTGDNFLAYWDGTQWKIGNLASLLPAGNGVLIKNGSSISLVNGTNGDFLQVLSGNIQFNSTIPGGIPTGTVVKYAANSAPSGWVLCNGALYGRTALDPSPQPNLFGVIGTTYGFTTISNFAVPDLRGMFVRGFDNGRGIDPLRAFGSNQTDSFKSHNHNGITNAEVGHTHPFSGTTALAGDHSHTLRGESRGFTGGAAVDTWVRDASTGFGLFASVNPSGAHTHTFNGTAASGTSHTHGIDFEGQTETRPQNVAMNYIIKT
jgi:microcystin-dependent protein